MGSRCAARDYFCLRSRVAAGRLAADFITRGKQPGLYRIHEGPTPEKVEILRNYLRMLGIKNMAAAELKEKLLPAKLENEILFKDGYCGIAKYLKEKKLTR